QGFLEATVEYALRREDLRDGFMEYLKALAEKEQNK
ncbi:MAG: UTP--glucose-1-phosphate uridylyltransferase, partial [Clostridium sp.]|nr:UTP--glucose-1-phosphate uridylyltransferase [Clostridium sp.]